MSRRKEGVNVFYSIGDERAREAVAITPHDSNDITPPIDAFRVGTTAGAIKVIDDIGNTVTIPGVQVGETIALRVTRIYSTDTTATGITGFRE